MNTSKKLIAGLVATLTTSVSFADTCDQVQTRFGEYYWDNPTAQERIFHTNPECFGGGPTTSFTMATAISRGLAGRTAAQSGSPVAGLQPGLNGLAAGGQASAWNVWANVEQNDSRFSYTAPNANRTKGASDVQTAVIGADYALSPTMVFGVSAAFDNGNGWGRNGVDPKNKNDTDGFVIAPYLGYQINKEWAADFSVGMGRSDFSATGGVNTEADRWFAAANLNYARWVGNWQFTGKASYMHGVEDYDNVSINGVRIAGTDVKNKVDQIRFGAQAGYWMNGFMPYAGLSYTSNVLRDNEAGDDPLGRDSFVATLGLNFISVANKLTGGVYYEEELSRTHSNNRIIAANINFRF